jgi:hypothetical protein
MGNQKHTNSSSLQHKYPESGPESTRRRNTVHAPPQEPAPGTWPLPQPYYNLGQPQILPLYQPFLQLAQYSALQNYPFAPYHHQSRQVAPQGHLKENLKQARSVSVGGGNRPRSRSPEKRKAERGNGNSQKHKSDRGGKSPMMSRNTPTNLAPAPGKGNDVQQPSERRSRPPFGHNRSSISHQSNSMPSTPQTHPRKLSGNSRSPSPTGSLTHSPRSAYSESNATLPTIHRQPIGCRFEKGMSYTRRRMPYSLGNEKLEKAKGTPKPKLNKEDEEKLSGDMRELYDRLLPSEGGEERRLNFIQKLERIFNSKWPGHDIKVHMFGSSGNLLCTNESDGQ